MNKSILIKILVLFILSTMLIMQTTYAADSVLDAGEGFIDTGKSQTSPIKASQIKTVSDQIYNILLAIGTVIAVIIGAILGIQFMVGSMDDKAKVKESLIPFVIGCVIIFGAFGIWKIVATILQDV